MHSLPQCFTVQIRDIAVSVNSTFSEVQSIVSDASSVVESATQYAMELRNRSQQLRMQASEDEERSQINANVSNRFQRVSYIAIQCA